MNNTFSYGLSLNLMFPKIEPIEIKYIKRLTKRFDYSNNFFPIFEVECMLEVRETEIIRQNRDNMYCVLKINQKIRSIANDNFNTDSQSLILEEIFVPYFSDNSFSDLIREEDMQTPDKEGGSQSTTGNPAIAGTKTIRFAMYSTKGLQMNKRIFNIVTGKNDVGTVVRALALGTDAEKIIIDQPDNETEFDTVIVPPKNINLALKELQLRYGIYDNGITTFYDPPYLYVLQKYSLNHDYDKDHPHKIILNNYVDNPLNVQMPTPVTLRENGGIEEYQTSISLVKANQDAYKTELIGNELLFTNYGLTSNAGEYVGGELKTYTMPFISLPMATVKNDKTGIKQIIDYDELNNIYNIKSYLKMVSLRTLIVLPKFEGVDTRILAPNVDIQLNIKDDKLREQEFNGNYSLLSGEWEMTRGNPQKNDYLCMARNLLLVKNE